MGWALALDLSNVTFRQVSVRIHISWITLSIAVFILSRKTNKQTNKENKIHTGKSSEVLTTQTEV